MLRLLDGNQNVNGSVNENYGRELQELYTIGRGLEGTLPPATIPGDYFNYTEQDVRAAARVLSGWELDTTFTTFDPDKVISYRNNAITKRQSKGQRNQCQRA